MNQFVPDWNNNMGDNSRPLGEDDDLIELLWCNGHVVMQSQSHRKLPPRPEKPAPAPCTAPVAPAPAPTPPAQEDDAGLWFPFALADSLDKDIFSDFFCEPPASASAAAAAPVAAAGIEAGGKPCHRDDDVPVVGDDRHMVSEAPCELMPPPKSTAHVSCSRQQTISLGDGDGGYAEDLSELVRARKEVSSSSMLSAIGSSICGSNQVLRAPDTAAYGGGTGSAMPSAVGSANANASGGHHHEATVASSSGRSNGCFGATTTTEPTSTSNRSSKRKRLDTTEDSESPSEDAESESAAAARKPPKLTTARRTRAAEVHNLSERRRRDRINEKMRALQELIPHCNKMMWMGGGIAAAPPVMFPGVHQYLPRMGVGMGAAAAMSSMPRMPFMAPQPVVPSAPVNPVPLSPGFRGHMPAVGITEPYAHYLGVNHLQPAPSQGVSYYPLGAKAVPQNPALHVPSGSMAAAADAAPGVLPPESAPNRGPG
ncbi:hypothetical protein EJB05_52269 [Eragrostis curvula]|uniref:BHLH domain-containing protein n=1 Tax=Eragrostis curvula TaxID=38414 RepID=A0A5J9STI0_9POAL|nr:hypothetical protein EJB05_52269 [Eragrostis curvula]